MYKYMYITWNHPKTVNDKFSQFVVFQQVSKKIGEKNAIKIELVATEPHAK